MLPHLFDRLGSLSFTSQFDSRIERLSCGCGNVLSESIDDARPGVWLVTDGPELDVLGEALSASSERGDIGTDSSCFERQAVTFGGELISATP